jgi:TRAP-type C4-dicarboxylate transport system substrate-binding protein
MCNRKRIYRVFPSRTRRANKSPRSTTASWRSSARKTREQKTLAAREIDGQENPLADIEDNKFYEVCKYVDLTSHQWAGYNMLANQAFWQKLPQVIRDVVVRNTKKFVPEQRVFAQALNTSAAEKLKGQGMILTQVDT